MRFLLHLSAIGSNNDTILPIDYQYFQSAVIYKILALASEDFASWLHENGYLLNGAKRFKLFCYSRFKLGKYQLDRDRQLLRLIDRRADWLISFLPERSTLEFVQGLFCSSNFIIGDKKHRVCFHIDGLELLPPLNVEETSQIYTTVYDAISPVCIKEHRDRGIQYLSPADTHYAEGILKGLLSRYEALNRKPFYADTSTFRLEPLSEPKSTLIKIKDIKVRGYRYKFSLTAPAALHHIAYDGGIGEQCSQGFGFIKMS